MTQLVEAKQPRLSLKRARGRVSNAVAGYLRTKLYVPHVFLNPGLPGNSEIDVLAVDRSGSGDLHGVEVKIFTIFPTPTQFRALLKSLKEQPLHFKYVAMPAFSLDLLDASRFDLHLPELFDRSGIGRIGVFSFDQKILSEDSEIGSESIALTIRPERFLLRDEKLAVAEKFLRNAKPDMAVRI